MMKTELEKEQDYLQLVYRKLIQSEHELSEMLQSTKEGGLSALKKMTEDIRLNFTSYSDNLETFAMIESKNREIDQMNSKLKNAEAILKKVQLLLKSPYFGKIKVDFLENEPVEEFYIGVTGFADRQENKLVYDWRSPIAELFYNNIIGSSFYTVNQNQIEVSIAGRRQLIITGNELVNFFDTAIAIQDDVLLEALEQDSSNQMKNITATIQEEQNSIIRDTKHAILLVNGVAGSGKTSAIMQRIAYLLYSLRHEITSENVLILSPNNKFISYISDVLPSLGERNPLNMTLLQFVGHYLAEELENEQDYFTRISKSEVSNQTVVLRSKEYMDYIQESARTLKHPHNLFSDIKRRGKVIISKERIEKIYQATPVEMPVIKRIQATKSQLASYWEQEMLTQAKSVAIQNQILSLSEELQKKYFGALITDDSEKSIFKYGEKLLRKKYQGITKAIGGKSWINLKGLFIQLYFDFTEERYVFPKEGLLDLDEGIVFLMIQNNFVEKIAPAQMRFVLIDEVQDYTAAQLYLVSELFPSSDFTMVGDENQAIFNSSIDFNNIYKVLETRKAEIQKYDLLNSYRSSGAITKVFRKLATSAEAMTIIPIRPNGNQPQFFQVDSTSELLSLLQKINLSLAGEKLTIITKTEAEMNFLLGEIELDNRKKVNVELIPLSLSKGLEFDNILIYNASNGNYDNQRDQKMLYTAISRGMNNLFISYKKELSRFLS